ncbi:MAG TPA: serine/threonine-protein kinase [Anaeromyxobacteraceae bacterium]|nr:serine/threonine-protein kinase [Anaeromyxobacteraceae bacterium]
MSKPTPKERPPVRRIDRYELLDQVGTGGMSAVYRGRDTALDREVAVKVLHPHLASRAESRARFSREARAVARLSHPSIVEIYDYSGDGAEESWLVTEFVHGRTLRAFADEAGIYSPQIGALLCRQLADALAHAHAAGVIHRDLKPENVMISEEAGRRAVKLADFGIARILALDDKMTMTGALVGSPNHMAPEIIEGGEADARSDVFSLGTMLYWLCTGTLPFQAPNATATMRRVVDGHYPDLRVAAPAIGSELARVVRRALERDPDNRQASAAELRDDLDRALAADGLERPGEELSAFLEAPEAYKRALPARVVAARVERGEAALARGETTAALDAFDGVLALEPGHPDVLRHLARLALLSRWRRIGRIAAALLLLLLLLSGGLRVLRRFPRPAAPGPPQAVVATPPLPAPLPPAPHPPASAPREDSPPPPKAAARAEPPRAAAPKVAPVALAVHVRPYAQRALLDGVEVGRGEQRVVFQLGPGPHRIRIEHPCCDAYEREIDATQAAKLGELKVPLAPRPAFLRVEGPAEARVFIDGQFAGTAEDSRRNPFRIPVPAGAENPYEGEVALRIEVPGQAPVDAPLRIRAGQEITVPAVVQQAMP